MQIRGISVAIIVILILLALHSAFRYIQTQNYRMAVRRMRKLGNVGIGQKGSPFLNGHVAIIACDNDGIITGAEVLDGIGAWSQFHPVDRFLGKKLVGSSIYDFLAVTERFSGKRLKKWQEYVRALEALEVRISDRELTREQEKYMDRKFGKTSY